MRDAATYPHSSYPASGRVTKAQARRPDALNDRHEGVIDAQRQPKYCNSTSNYHAPIKTQHLICEIWK
jgi:hypothetical protein